MLSVSEVEQPTQHNQHKNIGSDKMSYAPCSGSGPETSQPKNGVPFTGSILDDTIVISPTSMPRLHDQVESSFPSSSTLPERVAIQLEKWYTHRGRLSPPPCAVGRLIAQRTNRWKSDQPVLWSYMGIEELSVRVYELDGFEHEKDRHIIVAQGPTKGPFIIKCFQNSGRNEPPVSYHVWNGWNGLSRSFERKPSISKSASLQDNNHRTTLSRRVPTSQSQPQPHSSYPWTGFAPPAENSEGTIAHEKARAIIFNTSASPSHPIASMPLCDALRKQPTPPSGTMPTTFTPPTIDVASPSPEHAVEELRPSSPSTREADRAHISRTAVHSQRIPNHDPPPVAKSPQSCQHSLISSHTHSPVDSLDQESSHSTGPSLMGTDQHQTIRYGSTTRPASPVQSDASWETLRSSRETSYTSEMQIEMEREFSRSEDGDYRAIISPDESTRDCSSPARKRKWEGANGNMDAALEGALPKRTTTVHPSQTPSRAHLQANPKKLYPGLSSEDPAISTLRDQVVQWKEVYEGHGVMFGTTSNVDALQRRLQTMHARRTDQLPVNSLAETENVPQDSRSSQIQPTSFSPVPPATVRNIRDASTEQLQEATESEDYESLGLSGISKEHRPSRLHCNFDDECGQTFAHKNYPTRHIKAARRDKSHFKDFIGKRQLEPDDQQNEDQVVGNLTRIGMDKRVSPALSPSATEQNRIDTSVSGPKHLPHETFLPHNGEAIFPREDVMDAEEVLDPGTYRMDHSERCDRSLAALSRAQALLEEHEEYPANGSSDMLQEPLLHEASIDPQHLPIDREDLELESSVGEGLEEEYSCQGNSEAEDSEYDPNDSGTEAAGRNQGKKPLRMRKRAKALAVVMPPTSMSGQARAKLSKVVNNKRKCGLCKKWKSIGYVKYLSSRTDRYICRNCLGKESVEQGVGDGRILCADCDTYKRKKSIRNTNPEGHYICCNCKIWRNSHEGQPRPKSNDVRPEVTVTADKRCDDCGGDNSRNPVWPRNPDREGGYMCRTCAAYLKNNKVHRNLDEMENESSEKIRDEIPNSGPDQEHNLNSAATAPSEPMTGETIEDSDFMEIRASPPSTTVKSAQLRHHIRENVVLLFYTPAGKKSLVKSFGDCESVYKLFGQAVGAKAFGPSDERWKPEGNVLSVCFGAGQSDVGQDLRVVEGDKEAFDALVEAIEQRDWWRERNGAITGSGTLEVRAVG